MKIPVREVDKKPISVYFEGGKFFVTSSLIPPKTIHRRCSLSHTLKSQAEVDAGRVDLFRRIFASLLSTSVALVLMLLLPACATEGMTQPTLTVSTDVPVAISPEAIVPEQPLLPERPSKEEIAQRAEETLRNAPYFTATIKVESIRTEDGDYPVVGGTEPVVIDFRSAKNAFRTILFKRGERIFAVSLVDGIISERMGDGPLSQSDSDYPHGTDTLENHFEEECFIGSHQYSWVGVEEGQPLDKARSFRNKIANGEQEADAIEGGHDCYVFRSKLVIEADGLQEIIWEVVWVDKVSFLWRRYDTIQPGVYRKRSITSEVHSEVPPGDIWGI